MSCDRGFPVRADAEQAPALARNQAVPVVPGLHRLGWRMVLGGWACEAMPLLESGECEVGNNFVGRAERVATELAGAKGLGPSDFRELLPVTRKHLIPILSHFDQSGLTIRGPDGRDVAMRGPN